MVEINVKELAENKEWRKLYNHFEELYNPYPVEMSRSSAFGHALKDGLITEDQYKEAHEYFGNLWNYVGD